MILKRIFLRLSNGLLQTSQCTCFVIFQRENEPNPLFLSETSEVCRPGNRLLSFQKETFFLIIKSCFAYFKVNYPKLLLKPRSRFITQVCNQYGTYDPEAVRLRLWHAPSCTILHPEASFSCAKLKWCFLKLPLWVKQLCVFIVGSYQLLNFAGHFILELFDFIWFSSLAFFQADN